MYEWFADLPAGLRYGVALGLLGIAGYLHYSTHTIYVWLYGIGFAFLVASLLMRDE